MSRVQLVVVVVALLLVGLVGLAAWQNSLQTTDLYFDAGVRAWHLKERVPVVALVGAALIGGLALGSVMTARVYGRRVKLLRDQLRYGDSASEYR